jgi:2-C-methyl-D-erythritol 4-phosphate cytidylyltransferase
VVSPDDGFFERAARPPPALVVRVRRRHPRRQRANGLRELRRAGAVDNDWVLVHDAARCLVTPEPGSTG